MRGWLNPVAPPDATVNLQRIRDAGVEDGVFPIHSDARSLPFDADFFDAVVSIDSFMYYGTDDLYLGYLARLLKPGGAAGIAVSGFIREIEAPVPEHLRAWWEQSVWCLHSAAWWRRHWERTGLISIELADTMPDGWQAWLAWHRNVHPDNQTEIKAVEADRGRYLGYVRVVGRRGVEARVEEPVVSIPTQYFKRPLLREKSARGRSRSRRLRKALPETMDGLRSRRVLVFSLL
jgi:SAM-dependent methyltransferase